MKQLTWLLIAPVLAVCIFSSCVSNKNFQKVLYFRDSVNQAEKVIAERPTLIMPGDRLNISITAINKEAADAFNVSSVGSSTASTGYFVDSLGNIQLLQLGVVHVAGLTTGKLQDTLQKQLGNYIKGPVVNVNIINFRVNMMGEITTPGALSVPDGKINILQAITQAGDLKSDARRDNILVIRERNGVREFGRVDITSNHVFESPYFNLQQSDIVYIEPDKNKYIANDAQLTRITRNYTFALTVVSSIVLIISLFKK